MDSLSHSSKSLTDLRRLNARRIVLGKIVGVFGVGGWLKVDSYTDPPANILKYKQWFVQMGHTEHAVKLLHGRMTAKGVQVQFEGVLDRTAAEPWTGAEIAIDRSELPPAPKGQYYWADLVGLNALSVDGKPLGKIVEIRELPAHPMLVIRPGTTQSQDRPSERGDVWVPLVPERLKAVDLEGGVATVDWDLSWLAGD